ncbi:MAG: transglutaminase-like domain-containing protein [Bacteroidetes bacterium]|nr:transglutaminase-like domain-containing protein [Bacteroidota bacterium]
MNPKEINSLIKLLDDTDAEIYQQIEAKLVTMGKEVIPILESAWSSSLDALMQHRIENIIHKIQLEELQHDVRVWAHAGGHDIIKGAMLVAKYQYPDLNEENLRVQLDKITRDAWLEMNDNLTALEQVKVLNRIFFDIHGFGGNTQNYHAPQNSYINIVMETKKANPLMLSILYLEVARSAGVPVYGVNLPEHFVLCYKDEEAILPIFTEESQPGILFYINPFSKGDIFGRKEIDNFLKQLKIEADKSYYEPCTNLEMIQRLIRNLMNSYHKLGFMEKVEELNLLMRATE